MVSVPALAAAALYEPVDGPNCGICAVIVCVSPAPKPEKVGLAPEPTGNERRRSLPWVVVTEVVKVVPGLTVVTFDASIGLVCAASLTVRSV